MSAHAAERSEGGLLPLFFGILGPPVIWAMRIATSYVLVPYACAWGMTVMLHLVTLVALVASAVAGAVAWRQWRATGKGTEVDLGGTTTRTRFLALFGILSSALFILVMMAEGLANFFLDPCQTAGAPIA